MTDAELVKACIEKNPNAQRLLFERFCRKMMGICLRYASLKDEADDMLQNGFIKVFEKIETYRAEGSLEGWIRKIIVNEALTYLRKNKKLKMNVDIDNLAYDIPSNNPIGEQLNEKELLKMIQRLPIGFRTIFNMYAIEGYSHAEIGEQLGITESTSRSQYTRAKALLKKRIHEDSVEFKSYQNAI